MKNKVISFLVVLCLLFSTTVTVFAENNYSNKASHFTMKDENGKNVDIEILEENNIVTVNVYVDGKFDHKAVTNKSTGEISVVKCSGEKSKSHIEDYVNDVEKSVSINKKYDNSVANMPNIMADNGSGGYGDGYSYVENHFSLDYQLTGYLYSKYLGSQGRRMEKRFTFTAGTAVGVVVGVLSAFITGGVTIGVILLAAGSSVVGGVLGSYVDSSICFDYLRTLYRVRVNGIIGLDTYIDQRMEVVYNYLTGKETYINAGLGGGFAGSNYDMIETGCMLYRQNYGY